MTPRRHCLSDHQRQEIRYKIADTLQKRREILFAVLFGTFQEGLAFQDIDVAVYLDKDASNRDRFENECELALELERELRIPVDVHILNGASLGFQYAVSGGELLFARHPSAFCDFRERVWLTYLDRKYFYEQSLKDLLASRGTDCQD